MVRYTGKLKTVEEYENIVIKAEDNGNYLRLKDVARVELGALSYTGNLTVNGKPGTNIAVSQTPGSNARDVIVKSLQVMDEVSQSFPEGIHYVNTVNANKFLDASIAKIVRTLLEAFILVFLVVYLFLQDFRSTLIPAISVPVALIGTFFFLYLFGFSINLLTLFALLLAIGIVVDDAIVVVEVMTCQTRSGYTSSKQASIDGMNEISNSNRFHNACDGFSVHSGDIYFRINRCIFQAVWCHTCHCHHHFCNKCPYTHSCTGCYFLKPKNKEGKKQGGIHVFYTLFNTGFEAAKAKYVQAVGFFSKKKWIAVVAVVVFSCLFAVLMKTTPGGFVEEDMGTYLSILPFLLRPPWNVQTLLQIRLLMLQNRFLN